MDPLKIVLSSVSISSSVTFPIPETIELLDKCKGCLPNQIWRYVSKWSIIKKNPRTDHPTKYHLFFGTNAKQSATFHSNPVPNVSLYVESIYTCLCSHCQAQTSFGGHLVRRLWFLGREHLILSDNVTDRS